MSDIKLYREILKAKEIGQTIVLATIISESGSVPRHTGAKMIIYPDGRASGTIGGGEFEFRVVKEAGKVFESGKSKIITVKLVDPLKGDAGVCGGRADIFLEIIMVDPVILIIGAGHCGKALSELAHWLGFFVIVVDDRIELCNPDQLPDADQCIVVKPEEITREISIHPRTYIAAVTRNIDYDLQMIPTLLATDAGYIGLMGSKRRWLETKKKLLAIGVSESDLERITAPIGLEIYAETPEEIAVSIMGQIITAIRGK